MTAVKCRSAVILASLALLGVLASPASAGGPVSSAVTIKAAKLGPSFHGRVISAKGFCERKRKVWLVGVYPDGAHPIDFDLSNDRGKWKLSTQLQGASFVYARAARKSGNGIHCRRASSAMVPTL